MAEWILENGCTNRIFHSGPELPDIKRSHNTRAPPYFRYFEIVKLSFVYRFVFSLLAGLAFVPIAFGAKIFIPMDAEGQVAHLKAYGVAYAALKLNVGADWLLNYKGGSFGIDDVDAIERLCKLRGVSYEVMSDAQYNGRTGLVPFA